MFGIPLSLLLAALTGANALKSNGQSAYPLQKPFSQDFTERMSPLKLLGGLGPYTSRSGNGISTEIPDGCDVDQVVLLQRHGERYPSKSSFKKHNKILDKIFDEHPDNFDGDLEFLNEWVYFVEREGDVALEIQNGPYSGLADLYQKGASFGNRYGQLWDGESGVPLFVAGSERVLQSAREFGRGMLGYNYSDVAQINVYPEGYEYGANSLDPWYCNIDEMTSCDVPDKNDWDSVFKIVYPPFEIAADRLNDQYNLTLTGEEVGWLMDMGAFDVAARGTSPWLDVFTREEWTAFNYRRGVYFQCFFGHESKMGRAFGTSWANATTKLLNQGPVDSGLPYVLNFAHDVDITDFLAGMDILKPLKPVDPNQITFDTRWDISDIAPMGAQLIIERMTCGTPDWTNATNLVSSNATVPDAYVNATLPSWNSTGANNTNSTQGGDDSDDDDDDSDDSSIFVRVILNDAVVPLDNCYDGPGYSCSLNTWTEYVANQTAKYNYGKTCKPETKGYPGFIDFYWNYNATSDWNDAEYIPWQGTSVL